MKKLILMPVLLFTLIAQGFSQGASDISGSATYGFESEFFFRGFQISDDTFTPAAEGRLVNQSSVYYAGVRTALPVQKEDNKKKLHEYYVGGEFQVMKDMTLDIGLNHFDFLPMTDESVTEVILGVSMKNPFNPSLYVYYDFDDNLTTLEGSFGYAIPIDQKSAVLLTAFAGLSDFYLGSKYAGIMADYSYSFTRYARFVIGGRIAYTDPDTKTGLVHAKSDTRSWWGVSFTAGF